MSTFTIDEKNNVLVHDSDVWVDEPIVKFQMEQELAAIAATWPATRLLKIWNKLPGVRPVAKFKDRATAVRRIWNAIQHVEPRVRPAREKKTRAGSVKATAKTKEATKTKAVGASKTDQVLAALRSANGASLKQLMALTGWQSHSVRGFLSAQVTKRMGLRVKSVKRDGDRFYRLRS